MQVLQRQNHTTDPFEFYVIVQCPVTDVVSYRIVSRISWVGRGMGVVYVIVMVYVKESEMRFVWG